LESVVLPDVLPAIQYCLTAQFNSRP